MRVSNPKMMRTGNITIRKSGTEVSPVFFAHPLATPVPLFATADAPDFLIGLDSPGDPVVAMSGYG